MTDVRVTGPELPVEREAADEQSGLDWLTWVLAAAAGLGVANLYYNQPLLADMARDLRLTERQVGLVPVLSQVGYALGMLLIVPLGDIVQRRTLIALLLGLVAAALVAEATARDLAWLAGASFAIGITTVVPQVILPLAAQLAPPGQRGKVVGTVFAGLLVGILLSRTLSGTVAHHFGWRSVYWLGAGMMVALGVVLAAVLPRHELAEGISYRQLLRSVVALMKREPVLRQASLNGALLFAAFSAFWATLIFRLETPPFHYGERAAGLFGIVGAAGALAAPVVGRFADRISPRSIVGWATGLLLVSYLVFWVAGATLAGLIAGVVLLDLAVQSAQVSNLTRVYAAAPASAQSRANTAFMTCYFLGGSAGSLLGIWAWSRGGWTGVCLTGLALAAAALLAHAAPAVRRLVTSTAH